MPTVILLDVSLSMCRSVRYPTTKTVQSDNKPTEPAEIKQLANVGIGALLDYLAQNTQLEYTSLVVFSSLWEIRHEFTRHHESIKNGIYDLELYDKSNIVNAFKGALSLKLAEWSQNGQINLILITDGQLHDRDHEKDVHADEGEDDSKRPSDNFHDISLSELQNQFNFPCKVQVICLAHSRDPALKHSIPFFRRLISIIDPSVTDCPLIVGANAKNFRQSAIWIPESDGTDINVESVEELFSTIAQLHYKPYHVTLSCGHLESVMMLSPRPTDCLVEPLKNEFDDLKKELSMDNGAKETFVSSIYKVHSFKLTDSIDICGFLPTADVASPTVISRHLVIPMMSSEHNEIAKAEQILLQEPGASNKPSQVTGPMNHTLVSENGKSRPSRTRAAESEGKSASSNKHTHPNPSDQAKNELDITKQPNFAVLLHNGLKQENMVAVCIVGRNEETNEDWFGILHGHTDSKKRSSLMLSLLQPGSSPILWLPSFRTMGSSMLVDQCEEASNKPTTSAPLKSYSSNNVLWLDPESVRADVHKIVRHAKRPPDKAPHFYKELIRIRRAAISYGFYDVLFGLAAILEREKRIMSLDQSKPVNQETLAHIDHVVSCLRAPLNEDSYDAAIMMPQQRE